MFTDIVGYSSLMGENEQRALQMVRDNRLLHETLIRKHHGELVKEMGDGMLAVFHAAYDSIQCALALQNAIHAVGNYQVRIGIHLGDILLEHEDVFGDDVNITSRIQSIADPGGIYLSESLYKAVQKRTDLSVQYLGEFQFKNISDPVRTYAIQGEGLPAPAPPQKQLEDRKKIYRNKKLWYGLALIAVAGIIFFWKFYPELRTKSMLKTRQSIAVLPFANLSGDTGQEYIIEGLQDAIIGQLSKITDLRVISRTSTIRYRETNKAIPEIAKELKVDNIIEASVLGAGDVYQIQVQLIQAFPLESHKWSNEYKCDLNEAMKIKEEVARSIAKVLKVDVGNIGGSSQPVDPEVYKLYLRGMYNMDKGSPEDLLAGMEFLKEAVDLDPAAAFAYTGLAQGYMKLGHTFTADVDENETFNKAKVAAKKALSLDKGQAEAYSVFAEVSMYLDWDYKAAEEAFKNAILIKPSMVDVHAHYTWLHVIYNRWDDAVYEAKLAVELDPFSTVLTSWLAWTYLLAGRPDDAIEIAKKTIKMNADYSVGHMVLGNALADKGMYSKAIPSLKKAVELSPGFVSRLVRVLWQSGNIEEAQRVFEDYKDDPRLKSRDLAGLYGAIENRDGTIKYLNKMIEDHDQTSPWIYCVPFFRFLHDDPEFLDICRRANIPEEVIDSEQKNTLQRTAMVY